MSDESAGIWRLADPKISSASFAGVFLGVSAAAYDGSVSLLWLVITLLAVFGIEVGKNASGEVFDFDSGADLAVRPVDRSPFSGGKRVLIDSLLTRRQAWVVAVFGYATGAVAGILITVLRQPLVLPLGLAGIAIAFSYHAPPLKLAYRGFGELAVALCYGPGIVVGAYLVQTGTVAPRALLVSVPLGLLIAAFLWINEFPDYLADREAGKQNLVVRLGRARAAWGFVALVIAALLSLFGAALQVGPAAMLAGTVAFVPACIAMRTVVRHPENTRKLVPAQAQTLASFVLLSLGVGFGLLFGSG